MLYLDEALFSYDQIKIIVDQRDNFEFNNRGKMVEVRFSEVSSFVKALYAVW